MSSNQLLLYRLIAKNIEKEHGSAKQNANSLVLKYLSIKKKKKQKCIHVKRFLVETTCLDTEFTPYNVKLYNNITETI